MQLQVHFKWSSSMGVSSGENTAKRNPSTMNTLKLE